MTDSTEIVTFEDPRIRRKRLAQEWASASLPKKGNKKSMATAGDSEEAFDVEKARYEVLRFGITNEKHRDKRLNAKQQLLVSLGAKAPKNKYVNYKELKRELAAKKETQRHHEDRIIAGSKQSVGRRDQKRKKQDIDVTSGFGKLKHGELVVGADVRRTMRKVQQNAKRRQEQQKFSSRKSK